MQKIWGGGGGRTGNRKNTLQGWFVNRKRNRNDQPGEKRKFGKAGLMSVLDDVYPQYHLGSFLMEGGEERKRGIDTSSEGG